MCDSLQDGYAKHLKHPDYGYPLRMPEPMSLLPQQYQESGLEIGDVGIVDNDGQFDVLFNICKQSDHLLHEYRGVPENFQPVELGHVKSNIGAISHGPLCSHGVTRVLQPEGPRPIKYEFKTSAPSGAVLILPDGATCTTLLSTDQFREVAIENAHYWCAFTKKFYRSHRSLYLITGVYKASSWSLGSFNRITDATGEILAQRDEENPSIYILDFSFPGDRRHCLASEGGRTINQTVFIAGFRITDLNRLLNPVVENITRPDSVWSMFVYQITACLKRLRGSSRGQKQICIKNESRLSQPPHPSDIISDVLFSEDPEAEIAITHDDQWMGMMKEGMKYDDLHDELQLKAFLRKHYTISRSVDSGSKTTVVLLQHEGESDAPAVPVDALSETDSVVSESPASSCEEFPPLESPPPSPQLGVLPSATPDSMPLLLPTLLLENPLIVITHIRAENIPCGSQRIPAGFHVLVEFGDVRRRTQNKSTQLNDTYILWEDEISLPSETFSMVRFTIYASFELGPMLGNGEILYTAEVHPKELVGGTHLIMLSSRGSGTVDHEPSLLITSGKRYFDNPTITSSGSDDNQLESEESSDLVREAESGQQALLRYLNEYQGVDLDNATQHFENAWRFCDSSHRCRAVVLVNFAMARFMGYKIDPTSSNLDEIILLYRQALELRPSGDLDRPATALQFTQTLLYRYEKEGYEKSVAREIDELMGELQGLSGDSHERRAADLILETLHRCRVIHSGSLAELDDLVEQLKCSVTVPPDGYFDRPQRLVNLSTALWGYYKRHGKLDGLDDLVEGNKQALRLLPHRHPERLPLIKILMAALWKLFETHGDPKYLDELRAFDAKAFESVHEQYFRRIDYERIVRSLANRRTLKYIAPVSTLKEQSELARTLHIALAGNTGVGKSTLVNVLKGEIIAKVSNDADPCTPQSTRYDVVQGSTTYCIWDTRGLNERLEKNLLNRARKIFGIPPDADRELKTLLSRKDLGIDLVLFCIDAKKIRVDSQWKIHDKTRVKFFERGPRVAVVVMQMEDKDFRNSQWKRNYENMIADGANNLKFPDQRFIEAVPRFRELSDQSVKGCRDRILKLISRACGQ